MRPGRELDTFMAKEVLGHNVKIKMKEIWEDTEFGDRPLRKYSRDMTAAYEIMEKMNITLIPIEDGQWFAMAGHTERWKSPAEFVNYLQTGNFVDSGAAVGTNVPETICIAAYKAIQVQRAQNLPTEPPPEQPLQ
jgi:hypothetical protein